MDYYTVHDCDIITRSSIHVYRCFPIFFYFFLHLRLFKHYLSLEMYYIKVMINFTKNNHFFFYFAYHYLPLFFSPDKKPILLSKTIHAQNFHQPSYETELYKIHFRAELQIDIFPIFSFLGALHLFLDQFILYIPSACLFQQQCYCLQTNNALVWNKIS